MSARKFPRKKFRWFPATRRRAANPLKKVRLLFEPLEIRATVSDSLLGILSAGAILNDASIATESQTSLVADRSENGESSLCRQTDALLADFLESDLIGSSLSATQGVAVSAPTPALGATETTEDADSPLAPREHGQIEPIQVAAPGDDLSATALDLAAMSLLGGSGGQPNYPPAANDDTYDTKHDSTRVITQSMGVLYNDTDPNYGTVLTAYLVSGPSHAASFTFNSNGSFTYTPASGFVGGDTFVYRASDGQYSDEATVTINVWNVTPTANNDTYQTRHDAPLTVAASGVLANDTSGDGDTITAALVSGPAHAQSFTLNANGSFSYTPASHFVGSDTFTYRATDGVANSAMATVTINVSNAAPQVVSLNYRGGLGDSYEFYGSVSDMDDAVAGMTVSFGGILAGYSMSATVAADGTYSITREIPDLFSGYATARVTDPQGAASPDAMCWVTA